MQLPRTKHLVSVSFSNRRTTGSLPFRSGPRLVGSGKVETPHVPVSSDWQVDPFQYGTASSSRAHSLIPSSSAFTDPLLRSDSPRLASAFAAAGHVQVRHHPHLLLRGRRGAPGGRLPARLHLPRQGPGRLGAGHAPALARARRRPRRRPAPEPRRRLPPRARQPRPLRHELRHRRPRRRLPLPALAPRLPHRLPRLHARLARPLLPPRRAARPLRPRRRRRLRPRRARRRHARPPPAHRRHRQHPLLAARRPRARRPARRAAQVGGQRRRRGRPLVRAGASAAVALGQELSVNSAPCLSSCPCFQVFLQSRANWDVPHSR